MTLQSEGVQRYRSVRPADLPYASTVMNSGTTDDEVPAPPIPVGRAPFRGAWPRPLACERVLELGEDGLCRV